MQGRRYRLLSTRGVYIQSEIKTITLNKNDMIVLKMTSDYRQYLSGMTYAFLNGEGIALYNEGYATIVSEGTTVIEATKAEIDTLIADGGLTVGAMYKISDKGDNGMAFIAVSESKLSNEGVRFMLCPSTYAVTVDEYSNDWIGVWNATKTPTEGQLTIWNGLVWQAGETLSGDAPGEDGSGWTVIPKSSYSNHEYTEMLFGVWYDFENDWICKQWDGNGNVFGVDKTTFDVLYGGDNLIDYCDWNYATSGFMFANNTCHYCYNNSNNGYIYNNSNNRFISYNSNSGNISYNRNSGEIYNNSNSGEISNNSNAGYISNNSNTGGITDNRNTGEIGDNSNAGGIGNNSNAGEIGFNSNTGEIYNNSSLPATTCNITHNINNGLITGVWAADVTDTVVDKEGTAE